MSEYGKCEHCGKDWIMSTSSTTGCCPYERARAGWNDAEKWKTLANGLVNNWALNEEQWRMVDEVKNEQSK
jgi:hypothetical protein